MNPACEAALGAKLPVAKRNEIGKHLLHLHDKKAPHLSCGKTSEISFVGVLTGVLTNELIPTEHLFSPRVRSRQP